MQNLRSHCLRYLIFSVQSAWRLCAVCTLACAATAQAQTAVNGTVLGDTRWSLSGSPYVLSGEVLVPSGVTLTIEAGVVVSMAANAKFTVQSGAVQALGTAAQPIQVISDKTRLGQVGAPGDWDQWVFKDTTTTRLEHMRFEHGKGLSVVKASPVLNNLDIRNQLGAAIRIDLQSSPVGVGNRASGNSLNAIAVPAGDITGSVRWGVRGIPYVVSAATVSVGASPSITSVTPTSVEQGQSVNFTLNGTRLDDVASASLDAPGVTLTPFSTGASNQTFFQLKAEASARTGPANLRVQVGAGEVVLPSAVTITAPLPSITSLAPATLFTDAGVSEVVVTGRNFISSAAVLLNAAAVPTAFVSPTELRASVPSQSGAGTLQVQVRVPDSAKPNQWVLSDSVPLTVQAAVLPALSIEPTPIALPPDAKAREVVLRLSRADSRDARFAVSISDPTKASASPTTVLIPAGQTSAKISITPKVAGTVTLLAESVTLGRLSVPLFITADFRGANTAYTAPVGVVVERSAEPLKRELTTANALVGVAVGGVLTGSAPRAWEVNSASVLTIKGVGIPSGAQLTVVPSTGITVGAPTVNALGTELQVSVTTAADAPLGQRKLVVQGATGQALVFADPLQASVQLMSGLPGIDAIEPIVGVRGSRVRLVVRGRHLQQGQLRVLPDTGLRVDSTPVVSSDGSVLTADMEISADAPLGNRVVQVVAPAGATGTSALVNNSFAVVGRLGDVGRTSVSSPVGVVVGSALAQNTAFLQPLSAPVGVLVGAAVEQVTPTVGVVGSTVQVSVRGVGLQAVSAVAITPPAGVQLGASSVNAEGTELRFGVTVDASAALGPRQLRLGTGSNAVPLTFVRPQDGSFLVSAPVPELDSVEPQVVVPSSTSTKITLRGRNLRNVSAVRVVPAQGITVQGGLESSADGTLLGFNVVVGAAAATGPRTVVVTTAASSTAAPGNTLRVAKQLGTTYADLASSAVGVLVDSSSVPDRRIEGLLASGVVGVVVSQTSVTKTLDRTVSGSSVGVVVGSVAQTMEPRGWLQGASGTVSVTGLGLGSVASAQVLPSTGMLLGTPVANADGTVLSLSIAVAPDAPRVARQLRLSTAAGSPVDFADMATPLFGIGVVPSITSVGPIVIEQGKGVQIVVRGSRLKGVESAVLAPSTGVRSAGAPVWSQDALGELLTVPLFVEPNAPLGVRTLRLQVPGGLTPAQPSVANSLTVVGPQ
jgi:hypothetical protein